MKTLNNYIEEGILNRKSTIGGTIVIDELRRYSYDNLNWTDKSVWENGKVWWDEKEHGIVIDGDDGAKRFHLTGIRQPTPPLFNISRVWLPHGHFLIDDNDIETTKGIFIPGCDKFDTAGLYIGDNPKLTILEDLPQKVTWFEYDLTGDIWDEEDIDKVLYGIPKWCDKLIIRFYSSEIVKNLRKEIEARKRKPDPVMPTETAIKIQNYLKNEIVKRLNKRCPVAKNPNRQLSVHFNR